MAAWIRPIRCYVSPAGRNKIADWYYDLTKQGQADADEFIKDARKSKKWERPLYRALGAGIGELRWVSEDQQHRLLGFFRAEAWYAVIGCTHKQRIYQPAECLETAKKRKNEIEEQIKRGEVTTVDYDF